MQVSNAASSVNSATASLAVNTSPTIVVQLLNQSVIQGANVNLNVTFQAQANTAAIGGILRVIYHINGSGYLGNANGAAGSGFGQFNAPCDVALTRDGSTLYVSDTANNRIQALDAYSFAPTYTISSTVQFNGIGLSSPNSVAVAGSPTNECLYIADTGNDRVLVVWMPGTDPIGSCWTPAIGNLIAGDLTDAMTYFATTSVDTYRNLCSAIGNAQIAQSLYAVGTLTPLSVDDYEATYYFTQTIGGQPFVFFVTFVQENGRWKIRTF